MLVILLLIIIILILLRHEISDLIFYFMCAAAAAWLWRHQLWGKALAVALMGVLVLGVIGNSLKPIADWLRKRQATATSDEREVRPNDRPDEWFYSDGGTEKGPVSEEYLLQLLRERKLPPNTPIRWVGVDTATPANQLWANRF
jgi:hypothetical protein